MASRTRRLPEAPAHLAERLVDAVDRRLAEEGLAGLSLREVARRAGVTHGAPQRHYPSFATLLAEVAARGFRTLADAVDEAAARVAPGGPPTARLAAAAHAYQACAVKHPGRFALMFRPELLEPAHAPLARESARAFEGLVAQVRGAQDAGWRAGASSRELAGSLWAAMHGLASLWVHDAYPRAVPGVSLEASAAGLIDLLLGADAEVGAPGPIRNRTRRRA